MADGADAVRLSVTGIRFFGFHGNEEAERRRGNRFRIDLEAEGALDRAIQTDRLEDTVDYSRLVETVREISRTHKYSLIESLAGAIADGLLERFGKIDRITVRVEKLAPPGLGNGTCAAVNLTKTRPGGGSTSPSDRISGRVAP
jgi:7,8-dihydroneopterin aldolase/epimerase/oxygenase